MHTHESKPRGSRNQGRLSYFIRPARARTLGHCFPLWSQVDLQPEHKGEIVKSLPIEIASEGDRVDAPNHAKRETRRGRRTPFGCTELAPAKELPFASREALERSLVHPKEE